MRLRSRARRLLGEYVSMRAEYGAVRIQTCFEPFETAPGLEKRGQASNKSISQQGSYTSTTPETRRAPTKDAGPLAAPRGGKVEKATNTAHGQGKLEAGRCIAATERRCVYVRTGAKGRYKKWLVPSLPYPDKTGSFFCLFVSFLTCRASPVPPPLTRVRFLFAPGWCSISCGEYEDSGQASERQRCMRPSHTKQNRET